MLIVAARGHDVVDHLGDLLEFVVTLYVEAGKRGKGDCDERLSRSTAIYVVQISLYTTENVRQSQTC